MNGKGEGELAAVVLAAGSGGRLGLGPKAHVLLDGETFLSRIIRSCSDGGVVRVHVVGSVHDPKIAGSCSDLGVSLVSNPAPERGMWSSVLLGLRAAIDGGAAAGVIVFPVDVPLVTGETVGAVAGAIANKRGAWARPVLAGHGGHPIAIGAALAMRVLASSTSTSLRDALRDLGATPVDVPVDDPAITMDVDVAADLAAARSLVAEKSP
jgi:CTP:molybdopterin cytidylyltransferase MocA